MMGGGVCWIDFDGDGWLDLFLTNTWSDGEWGQWYASEGIPHGALFRNTRGTFEDVTEVTGLDVEMRGNGCVAADFNLDGATDLYVTSDRSNALFWNNGDGTFTEGAERAGVNANGWHTGAVVGDLNDDGWPDMFVAGYADLNNRRDDATTGFPNTFLPVRDLVFLNDGPGASGDVTFHEVGEVLASTCSVIQMGTSMASAPPWLTSTMTETWTSTSQTTQTQPVVRKRCLARRRAI